MMQVEEACRIPGIYHAHLFIRNKYMGFGFEHIEQAPTCFYVVTFVFITKGKTFFVLLINYKTFMIPK